MKEKPPRTSPRRHSNSNPRCNHRLAPPRHNPALRRIKIIPRRKGTPPRRCPSASRKLLNLQGHAPAELGVLDGQLLRLGLVAVVWVIGVVGKGARAVQLVVEVSEAGDVGDGFGGHGGVVVGGAVVVVVVDVAAVVVVVDGGVV